MFKNVASQSLTLYVQDASTGLPKTGDSANMVFYVSKDDGSVVAIAASSGVPTEIDSTNAKGLYKIALAQAETNADKLLFSGKSTTSNVVVVPTVIYTVAPNFSSLSIDSSGRVDIGKALGTAITLDSNSVLNVSTKYLAGTLLTARDIGLSVLLSSGTGTGQLSITSGIVGANATQWAGQATLLDANNLPKVDVEDIKGTVSAGVAGYIGPDWSHVNAPTTVVVLSGTTIGTLTTYTGNTIQTGDAFALLGSPANTTIAGDLAEIEGEIDTIVSSISGPPTIRKNTALSAFEFVLFSAADHLTPVTGRTVTAQRSIDGAALSSCTNSVAEVSNGIYKIDLSAADLNGNTVTLRFSATGADDCLLTIITQP